MIDEALRGARMPRSRQPTAEPLSQTSVRFPKPLIKRARIRAIVDEISLQELLVCALEAELDRRDKADTSRERRTSRPAPAK
jgi:hypothetical protein